MTSSANTTWEADMINVTRVETQPTRRLAPRSRRPVQLGAVAALLAAWTVSALAQIVAVGGDAVLFTPNSVVQDQNESDTSILAFDENQCFTLTADLETDQGIIPEGTLVSCHMMRSDPANPPQTYQGTAVFDGPILGVISDSALLDDSDDPCGLANTDYPAPMTEPFRGLEAFQATDQYQRVQNGCGLQVQMDVPGYQDEVRVITECCEEGEDCCEGD
jgi:hypothetical protein